MIQGFALVLLCTEFAASASITIDSVVEVEVDFDDKPYSVYVNPLGEDEGDCERVDDPCRTLAFAAKKAAEGGTVYVTPGVYTGSENFIDLGSSIYPANLSIYAYPTNESPRNHKFDALGGSSRLRIGAGNHIDGLGFTGFNYLSSTTYAIVTISGTGGGTITNCDFWDNSRAIALSGSSSAMKYVRISDITIDLNCSGSSSCYGVQMGGSSGSGDRMEMNNVHFQGPGYAIRHDRGTLVLNGVTADGCKEVIRSGTSTSDYKLEVTNGVFMRNEKVFIGYPYSTTGEVVYSGRATFTSCSFDASNCTCNGPALSVGALNTVGISSCSFRSNRAWKKVASTSGKGGAFYCDNKATLNIANSDFEDNIAFDGSPGWCNEHCGFSAQNCKAQNNKAEENTGRCPGL